MKKPTILLILTLIFSIRTHSQESIYVNTYESMKDYKQKKFTLKKVELETNQIGQNYISYFKFIDPESGKKLTGSNSIWAIEYKGENYFNMTYSFNFKKVKIFLKLDLEGDNYCASYISKDMPSIINNPNNGYMGSAMGGVLGGLLEHYASKSSLWSNGWYDKNENKTLIHLVNLNIKYGGTENGMGEILTKKLMKELFLKMYKLREIKMLKFENILEIIESHN